MKNNLLLISLSLLMACLLIACSRPGSDPNHVQARKSSPLIGTGNNGRSVAVVMGQITSQQKLEQALLVIAQPLHPGAIRTNKVLNYAILGKAGEYMLYLPEGDYRLYTIVDFNNNNLFEKTEISGWYNHGDIISLQAEELVTSINIDSGSIPDLQTDFSGSANIAFDYDSLEYGWENGEVVKIYDEIFSTSNADVGLWSSEQFFSAFGANIFQVEPYDPSKIPILFVHGIKGSPQDWIPFLIRMDRTRYQPWFFYYPSGMRLQLVSRILFTKLSELHDKYGFNALCLTAHSMGGFITQTLLTDYEFQKGIDFIKLYITLATPWSGFESADLAIATSPIVLPSWKDIASRSMFIKKLLNKSLPKSIPYYLFYGKNDSVSKGTALDERMFVEATGRFGFDVTHVSILSDKTVFSTYQQLLTKHLP